MASYINMDSDEPMGYYNTRKDIAEIMKLLPDNAELSIQNNSGKFIIGVRYRNKIVEYEVDCQKKPHYNAAMIELRIEELVEKHNPFK